ncbi:ABC transporter substrate-binding protein [Nostocoides jenkinsii]|jgi:NitT/TauT family transport system substrate-binding protein|uniref:ABC transporter substrate-binding protein n=1 Tax=Nostocoides jenkinsii Ben 74 TaxID=1193518 RepID=A0A077MD29_9MICO|nr:ABC transporter substrate-binding protein [Tetrasphaera jenkinsii]CCI53780.1 ABC transporter substrate-binding protein [Tetrasphaera jenkinsii Ben 74]
MSLSRRSSASLLVLASLGLAACSGSSDATSAGSSAGSGASAAAEVRLGYFPNVTHAVPIVADKEGLFAKHLGGSTLKISTFNAGPAAMEALKSGAIDATYVGPGPATNAFINSQGEAIRIVSGAATGGAALVVDPSITSVAQLKGKKIATPQLGNTQDVALRFYLKEQGLTTDLQGGGDVNITPQENSQILDSFSQKLIAGAWVPEPYATRLVQAGGKVLVDEHSLWPGGKFPVTVLAVRPDFLTKHPDSVKALLEGQLDAEAFIASNATKAQSDVGAVIKAVSGKALDATVISAAWKNLEFTNDPVPSALAAGAEHAYAVGILKTKPNLDGLVDLTILNQVLTAAGKETVR